MGFYLNSAAPGALYKSETENPYFVDKSQLLEELIPFVQQGNKHMNITVRQSRQSGVARATCPD